ncbi:MAG: hypothetical protein PHY34_03700 [Patescibacteria group bacterium]|nr:hypothetical protein [Patescibacteria group bacterium]MDD5716004.1 hypothetical protein [Patescibacteria group bacterium]
MEESSQEKTEAQHVVSAASMPNKKKIPIGAVILIIVGLIWLLDNWFSWLNDVWFPLVIITIGVYLLYKNR